MAFMDMSNLMNTFNAKLNYISSNRQFVLTTYLFLILEIFLVYFKVDLGWQWLVLYGWLFISTTTFTNDVGTYFKAKTKSKSKDEEDGEVDWRKLAISSYVTWIFAKSIFNAASLGGKFGIVGGLAYGCWYLAFPVVGFTIFRIRTQTKSKNLTELIHEKYGLISVILFVLVVTYRLFMEIWSNAVVVADLFGEADTTEWWVAVYVASLMPAVYIILGGFRTSIVSDVVQGVVVFLFLIIVWVWTLTKSPDVPQLFEIRGFGLEHGWDIFIVGVLQGGISYGFMDPVLTDRAFICKPRNMLKAFIVGGTIAFSVIFLFSFIGILGEQMYGTGNAIIAAQKSGEVVFNFVSIIFISSSVSTLDSTYSSLSKLVSLEIFGYFKIGKPYDLKSGNLMLGRMTVFFFSVVGPLILLSTTEALKATTISGTVVMGLGFPIIFFNVIKGVKPLAFLLPTIAGIVIGIIYQMKFEKDPLEPLYMGNGSYAKLLGVNVYGTIICFVLFVIGALLPSFNTNTIPAKKEKTDEPKVDEMNNEIAEV